MTKQTVIRSQLLLSLSYKGIPKLYRTINRVSNYFVWAVIMKCHYWNTARHDLTYNRNLLGHGDIEKVVSEEKIRQLSRSIMDVLWFSLWNKAE